MKTFEIFMDRYLISDPSIYDDSVSDVSDVSSSPKVDSPIIFHQKKVVSDTLRDILSQSQRKALV